MSDDEGWEQIGTVSIRKATNGTYSLRINQGRDHPGIELTDDELRDAKRALAIIDELFKDERATIVTASRVT